jgi:hypothetical protein
MSDTTDDAGAKLLAEWMGYSWEGLSDGRIGDRGFPQWPASGHYQGGKQDLRDLAAAIVAASPLTISDEMVERFGSRFYPSWASWADGEIKSACRSLIRAALTAAIGAHHE